MKLTRNAKLFLRGLILTTAVSFAAGCQGETPKNTPGATSTPGAVSTPSSTPEGSQSNLPGESTVTVRTMTIGSQNVTLDTNYTAQVLAQQEVEIRSRIEGYLQEFYFREGTHVTAGQILFTVDPRPLKADEGVAQSKVDDARARLDLARKKVNLKKAKAQLEQAQANLDFQQKEVDRYLPLVQKQIIPQQLYDQTVSARDVAKAQVDAQKAEVENTALRDAASIEEAQAALDGALSGLEGAQVNLDYTYITAPISGTIGELNVYPGSLVSPSNAVLATISSTDPIYVEFAISEQDYLKLKRAQEAGKSTEDRKFQVVFADGEVYDRLGTFDMVDRAIDQATGTLKVRLRFDNPLGTLRTGQYVSVRLNKKDVPDAILVPQRAVQELQSSNYVWVVKSDDSVEQREIEIGPTYESSYVVEKGLSRGDVIVVDGMGRLKPGTIVKPETGSDQ